MNEVINKLLVVGGVEKDLNGTYILVLSHIAVDGNTIVGSDKEGLLVINQKDARTFEQILGRLNKTEEPIPDTGLQTLLSENAGIGGGNRIPTAGE